MKSINNDQILIQTIESFYKKGWCTATSTNFSYRKTNDIVRITSSGVDKEYINESDLLDIDLQGNVLNSDTRKSSAETFIHTMIYGLYPNINAILHTHSPISTALTKPCYDDFLLFRGYEMQKGIKGITSHEEHLMIKIYKNSQDIKELSETIKQDLLKEGSTYGFLLKAHGLYAWGETIHEAKRHIEAFEFLFETQLITYNIMR